jgi:hypothetical protein
MTRDCRYRRFALHFILMNFLVAIEFAESEGGQGSPSLSSQERLRFLYASVHEGNEHEDAIESVEAGLGGGNDESSDIVSVFEKLKKDSSNLFQNLENDKSNSISRTVATSPDMLQDIKAEALSRLKQKIHTELEKETDALASLTADDPSRQKAATEVYKMVRQKLSFLPWVRSPIQHPSTCNHFHVVGISRAALSTRATPGARGLRAGASSATPFVPQARSSPRSTSAPSAPPRGPSTS